MTIAEWLRQSTQRLQSAGITTARLDCLILLEDATGHDRAWLLAHDDQPFEVDLEDKLQRREQHEPLAYIRGHSEFYGHDFKVSPTVLVPRPESENIINLAKNLGASRALDIGTGSGCLGISLKLERPDIAVMLSDIDGSALAMAMRNAQRLGADITGLQSDLLNSTIGSFDLILANLPYVPTDYPINQAAGHEPELALFSGQDGLDHYRRFWLQVAGPRPRWMVCEALPAQHAAQAELAQRAGYLPTRHEGYVQLFETL